MAMTCAKSTSEVWLSPSMGLLPRDMFELVAHGGDEASAIWSKWASIRLTAMQHEYESEDMSVKSTCCGCLPLTRQCSILLKSGFATDGVQCSRLAYSEDDNPSSEMNSCA